MKTSESVLSVIINFVRSSLDHFYRPALPVVVIIFATLVLFSFVSSALTVLLLFLFMGAVVFYNNPPRQIPEGAGLVLSPLDGHITTLDADVGLPLTFDQAKDQIEHFTRLTMYGALRGSRILRMPVTGTIKEILRYTPSDTADDHNWTCMDGAALLIDMAGGGECALVVNAPLLPHQLRLQIRVGDSVNAGTPIGVALLIAWVELYIPTGAPLLKTTTHQVVAGETVLQTPAWTHVPGFHPA